MPKKSILTELEELKLDYDPGELPARRSTRGIRKTTFLEELLTDEKMTKVRDDYMEGHEDVPDTDDDDDEFEGDYEGSEADSGVDSEEDDPDWDESQDIATDDEDIKEEHQSDNSVTEDEFENSDDEQEDVVVHIEKKNVVLPAVSVEYDDEEVVSSDDVVIKE